MSIIANMPTRFCEELPLGDPETHGLTLNGALIGKAHPRTLTKPTIVAPIAELSYWKTNPTTTYSKINTRTTKYPKLSGWGDANMFPIKQEHIIRQTGQFDTTEEADMYAIPQQPGIYTSTDVYQPINSTNGIAIVPEFPKNTILFETPTADIYYDTNTGKNYIVSDTNTHTDVYTPNAKPSCTSADGCRADIQRKIVVDDKPNLSSMYDPRASGYGSDNRSYLDEQMGQTRYFYDDIDAIRMPQYIVRSKLDSCLTPCGDSYGKVNSGSLGLFEARAAAEKSWVDNSLAFRESMMKSLMRKHNEEQVQKRAAPKNTYGSRRTYGY